MIIPLPSPKACTTLFRPQACGVKNDVKDISVATSGTEDISPPFCPQPWPQLSLPQSMKGCRLGWALSWLLLLDSAQLCASWTPAEGASVNAFARKYSQPNCRVLDVGGRVIQGGPRKTFEARGCNYTSMDIEAHSSVDVVYTPGSPFPFSDGAFDVSITVSTFEHDPMFWLTIREMARITRLGGHVFCLTPSTGQYHAHPGDNYRFLPDAGAALAFWIGLDLHGLPSYPLQLLDVYLLRGTLHESCMTFLRTTEPAVASTLPDLGMQCVKGSLMSGTCHNITHAVAHNAYNEHGRPHQGAQRLEGLRDFVGALPTVTTGSSPGRRAPRALHIGGVGPQSAEVHSATALLAGHGYVFDLHDARLGSGGRGKRRHASHAYQIPSRTGEFDLSVAISTLEHDPLWWMTVREMARVTKVGGHVYVSVVSTGPYQPAPGDAFRFMADSPAAIAFWTGRPLGAAPAYPLRVHKSRLLEGKPYHQFSNPTGTSTLEMVFARVEDPSLYFTCKDVARKERGGAC